jgi:SAM-dependent methyltransferase
MEIERLQREWDALGTEDPMWAILSSEAYKRGAGPEASKEREFFASGEAEIAAVMDEVSVLAPKLDHRSALDFGCGIGRLTRALAKYFDHVVGVDIAPSMITHARMTLPPGLNCEFIVNDRPDLRVLASGSFDFIYTRLVLQHIPADLSRSYIADFFRILRPGGLALFQVSSRPIMRPTWYRRAVPEGVKAKWHNLKAALSTTGKIRAFHVPREDVETIVRTAGGSLLKVEPDQSFPGFESFMYAATKS